VPLSPADLWLLERSRRDFANGIASISTSILSDCGILFQNGTCITLKRIFEDSDYCFELFLRYQGTEKDKWRIVPGLSSAGDYFNPEYSWFPGIVFAGNIRSSFSLYPFNRVFFVLNANTLLYEWMTDDIESLEFRDPNGKLIVSNRTDAEKSKQKILLSSPSGYTVIALLSETAIVAKMKAPFFLTVLTMALFLVVGLSLSFFLSWQNAIPLRKSMFERLLNGLIYTQEEWEEVASLITSFPPLYCVCLLRVSGGSSGVRVVDCAVRLLTENISAPVLTHHISHDRAVLLLPLDEERNGPEGYKNFFEEKIAQSKTSVWQQNILHIALSGLLRNREQLQRGYREVCQLMRVVPLRSPGGVFIWVSQSEETSPQEFADGQRFYELLLSADSEHASAMISRAFDHFDRYCSGESALYYLFRSFERVFVRIKAEKILEEPPIFLPPSYESADSIDQLREKILKAAGEICSRIKQSNFRKEAILSSSLISYIDKNISNPMLNLSIAASEFGLSDNAAGALIYKVLGRSFFDYLNSRRMEKAHALIIESKIPINDISRQCGFALTNSFYKAFKRRFGCSPSVLRTRDDAE
jgi:AraC-like DNA-binding protein